MNIYIKLLGGTFIIDDIKSQSSIDSVGLKKLKEKIANLEKIIAGFKARLKGKDFAKKAPKQIIAQQKETLAKKEAELQELKKHLASLK